MATQKTKKKYVVTIHEVSGTLDNDLFKIYAARYDIIIVPKGNNRKQKVRILIYENKCSKNN